MIKPKLLLLIAFVCGMCVTAIELSAARLLAPFFGTSVFIWTNIIAVVLGALALGYYCGGKLSERYPRLPVLLRIIFLAGILGLIIPWAARPLAQAVSFNPFVDYNGTLYIMLGSLFVSAALFGIPITLLGMVSPYLVRVRTLHTTNTGTASGNIFAWSTIGSIVGTFAPTWVFVPLFGTRVTILVFSTLLVVIGIFGFTGVKKRILLLVVVIPLLYPVSGPIKPVEYLLTERESAHQFIQVKETDSGFRFITVNEGLGVQSLYRPGSTLIGDFYDVFVLLPHLITIPKRPLRVLIIGLAGGTIARGLDGEFSDSVDLEAVEIDPVMTELAQSYFNLDDIPITIYHTDGRIFLESTQKQYDMIVVDAYQNELYIPWSLTTLEFWETVQKKMTPHGIIAFNVNSNGKNDPLLQSMANTMAHVFIYVDVAKVEHTGLNYLVTASNTELDYTNLVRDQGHPLASLSHELSQSFERVRLDSNRRLLTDDWAPVEFLTEQMLYTYSKSLK